MKKIGLAFITLGFISGAFLAVLDKTEVDWIYFTLCLVAGAVGILLIQVSEHQQRNNQEAQLSNINDIKVSLASVTKKIRQLSAEKESLNPYDVPDRIDQEFRKDLNLFVEARKSLAHVYGLQHYAEIMNCFAAGERYLNRVWSASADGYIDEMKVYLSKADKQFAEAQQKFLNLVA